MCGCGSPGVPLYGRAGTGLREKNGSSVRSRSERRDCDALPNWTLQRTWSSPTLDEVAKRPPEQRLGRMSRTAVNLAAATRGQSQAILMRRPGPIAARARDGSTCTLRCDRPRQAPGGAEGQEVRQIQEMSGRANVPGRCPFRRPQECKRGTRQLCGAPRGRLLATGSHPHRARRWAEASHVGRRRVPRIH